MFFQRGLSCLLIVEELKMTGMGIRMDLTFFIHLKPFFPFNGSCASRLKPLMQTEPELTKPPLQSKPSWGIPSPYPVSLKKAGWKRERERERVWVVYLFCYQEVITQSFSGADGPQEEDKDQIQEPPVGHQQSNTQSYYKCCFLTINGRIV